MVNAGFLQNMGVASIVAGLVLVALAMLQRRFG